MSNQTTKSNYTEMYNILKTRLNSLENEAMFLQDCLDLINKRQNKNDECYNKLSLRMLDPLAYKNNRFEDFPKENISLFEEITKATAELARDLSEIDNKKKEEKSELSPLKTKETRRKEHRYFNMSKRKLVKIILDYEDYEDKLYGN